GRIMVLEKADLAERHGPLRPMGDQAPRFTAASRGGRWLAVLFHNRRLWIYDTRSRPPANPSLVGQGGISAAGFDGPDSLLAADRGVRVTRYQLDSSRVDQTRAPELSRMEFGYHYALVPLYTIFPKPGELGNAVSYLLVEPEASTIGADPRDLSQARA